MFLYSLLALAVVTAIAVFLSAGLTLWRECVSNYQAFSASAVEAGEFARDNTPEHSTYMTGTQHLNPIASIAGQNIVWAGFVAVLPRAGHE